MSPYDWILRISSHLESLSFLSEGTKGALSKYLISSSSLLIRFCACTSVYVLFSSTAYVLILLRSEHILSTSISAYTDSSANLCASASVEPFSHIRLCAENTISWVDSPPPALEYTYPHTSLADCPETSCFLYVSLPIVSLLADALTIIVAPFIACFMLGGCGVHRSSHISTPILTFLLLSNVNNNSLPKGTSSPSTSTYTHSLNPGVNCLLS